MEGEEEGDWRELQCECLMYDVDRLCPFLVLRYAGFAAAGNRRIFLLFLSLSTLFIYVD